MRWLLSRLLDNDAYTAHLRRSLANQAEQIHELETELAHQADAQHDTLTLSADRYRLIAVLESDLLAERGVNTELRAEVAELRAAGSTVVHMPMGLRGH